MHIAFSPCPNDTFVFHAWVHGLLPEAEQPTQVTYADIDRTNYMATATSGLDVLKISYAALPWVSDTYRLLPCGGALGRGCGPLVLTAGNHSHGQEHNISSADEQADNAAEKMANTMATPDVTDAAQLSGARVAVPSERSTAYLLFRLWVAQNVPGGVGDIVIMPFHDIMPAVRDGHVDAGLVIHEARFTYRQYGLTQVVDLGNWWETDTGLPIPLGAIIARRSLDTEKVTDWIRSSVEYAWAHPEVSQDYVRQHAQEMDRQVAQAHIDLYVNAFTANLGKEGYAAVHALLGRAAEEGIVPSVPFDIHD